MKIWNLSSFDDLSDQVLSSVDQSSTTGIQRKKSQRPNVKARKVAATSLGAAFLVCAIAVTPVVVQVSGTAHSTTIKVEKGIWNAAEGQPPLRLLYGAKHPLKWDASKEREMLERALVAIDSISTADNRARLIHAALTEELPADVDSAPDLTTLGIKLG